MKVGETEGGRGERGGDEGREEEGTEGCVEEGGVRGGDENRWKQG